MGKVLTDRDKVIVSEEALSPHLLDLGEVLDDCLGHFSPLSSLPPRRRDERRDILRLERHHDTPEELAIRSLASDPLLWHVGSYIGEPDGMGPGVRHGELGDEWHLHSADDVLVEGLLVALEYLLQEAQGTEAVGWQVKVLKDKRG
jgi:hypothetical protein